LTEEVWEIFVPTQLNCGKPIRTRQHREWDNRVRRITGGLTILSPAKGQWVAPDGTLFKERMIPVRIVCTRAEIEKIIDITMDFYDQLAMLAYKVSSEVILKHKE
jgi:hypothetical protein